MRPNRFSSCTLLLFFLVAFALPARGADLMAAIESRAGNAALDEALRGLLVYLEDTQIRDRPGKSSSFFDASSEGEGCSERVQLNIPLFQGKGLPAMPPMDIKNLAGEWASFVHFLPKKMGRHGLAAVAIQDSNLFMTAFISFPLFFFTENLPPQRKVLEPILSLADKNISAFRRGDAFNFWVTLPGVYGKAERSGPYNIPVNFVQALGRAYLNPKLDFFWKQITRGLATPPPDWILACLDEEANPTKGDALFNIPNDADDTATAVGWKYLYFQRKNPGRCPAEGVDEKAVAEILKHRDTGRRPDKEDGRDAWKGRDTGAYLTWLRDENEETFSEPERGVVPLGKNNVDIVVNANVLCGLALAGRYDVPGFQQALTVVLRAIDERRWPEAGLYYPQNMIFPYAVTRALRDGRIVCNETRAGLGRLLVDLLASYRQHQKIVPGAFPGGEDPSHDLSTALGLCSLLNIGEEIASEKGVLEEFRATVRQSLAYLLSSGKDWKPRDKKTAARFGAAPHLVKGKTWADGLFFAASFWDLAHWRSQAFTNAMVLEALTRYRLAYDLGSHTILNSPRIVIDRFFDENGHFSYRVK